MFRFLLFAFSLMALSCGKNPATPWEEFQFPLTFNVPRTYYNTYKEEFDKVTAEITSKTGKQLVKFVPNDKDPKFATVEDSYSLVSNNTKNWVLVKNTADQFTDITTGEAGLTYNGISSQSAWGIIILNFSNSMDWSGYNFRQVIDHEVMHCLGFNHTFDTDFSIMNYNYVYTIDGITSLDVERLAEKFPFSLDVTATKDLEKNAAFDEKKESEKYALNLMENFGLSEARAHTISHLMLSFGKLRGMRELTPNEKDHFSNEILGFDYEKGKMALEKYMQGEKNSLDDLIAVAASKNDTSPEHIKELVGELFLK